MERRPGISTQQINKQFDLFAKNRRRIAALERLGERRSPEQNTTLNLLIDQQHKIDSWLTQHKTGWNSHFSKPASEDKPNE